MIKIMKCPECDGDIIFSYVKPGRSFRINKDGKIVRDDAWTGPGYDDPYFEFYCSNDKEHELGDNPQLQKWMEDVENEVFTENLFA